MKFSSLYQEHIDKYLTSTQIQTWNILVWLIQINKQVKIERLAALFPLPILYESRRKHIQRFLSLSSLSVVLIWFPIIQLIISQQFSTSSRLIITVDRTQWKDKNIFVSAVIWKNHALPIYWNLLEKRGSSNLKEQQALIRPILKLLNDYELVIIGDREFQSVELAYWLKSEAKKRKKAIKFAFRAKKDIYLKKGKSKEYPLKKINLEPGVKMFLTGVKVSKKKGFGQFNIAAYHRRKYRGKRPEEPWYILTNLDTVEETLKIYSKRTGIEAMFKDCKTGGYNLEGSKANSERLTRIILLIAFVYTTTSLKGKMIKSQGIQNYIGRLKDKKRTIRRHSCFWIGLYGDGWTICDDLCLEYVKKIKEINKNKLPYYQRGEKAMSLIKVFT